MSAAIGGWGPRGWTGIRPVIGAARPECTVGREESERSLVIAGGDSFVTRVIINCDNPCG
jgi:hypothetical protein